MASAAAGVGVGQPPSSPRAGGRPRHSDDLLLFLNFMARLTFRILARRPEEKLINDCVSMLSTLRSVTTGLAYLSLGWSSVVLLGGFVSALKLIDFWFLTAISAALAAKLPDVSEYNVAFVDAASRAYIEKCDALALGCSSHRRRGVIICLAVVFAEVCLGLPVFIFILVSIFFAVLLNMAPLFTIVLPLVRLVVNSYGDAGGDATNAAKLKASLQIFYCLAVAQSSAYYLWSLFLGSRRRRAQAVSEQCGFGEWGASLVWRYLTETTAMRATGGKMPRGRNLITFAVGLLSSESLDDRRSAVRVLDTFVRRNVQVGHNLLRSKVPLENLMEALELEDGEARACAARIVAALATDLRHIDHHPTALCHIASLLQAASQRCHQRHAHSSDISVSLQEQPDAAGRKWWMNGPLYWLILYLYCFIYEHHKDKGQQQAEENCGKPEQVISQGLLIIERLALHKGNCEHICSNHDLLSKITAPLNSQHAFLEAVEEDSSSEWTDVLCRSLRIVARLISVPGEASSGLRNGIASKTPALDNLTRVLEDNRFGPVLKTAAIEVLAELASDRSATMSLLGKDGTNKFIRQLWGIFLGGNEMHGNINTIEEEAQQEANRLRGKAGEALARMLSISSSGILQETFIQSSSEEAQSPGLRHVAVQLTDMLNTNRGSRTRAAEILERLWSNFDLVTLQRQEQDAVKMLTKVLQLIQGIQRPRTNTATAVVGGNSNHAVQTDVENPCPENHPTAGNKSSTEKREQQQEGTEFLVALLSLAVVICDRMVEAQCFSCAVPEDMDMVGLVTELTRIIEDSDATVECLQIVKLSCQLVVSMVQLKPSCIKAFTDHNFNDVLSKARKKLLDLDNCMLFDTNYNQVTKCDKPLASLVKQALQQLSSTEEELGDGRA